MKVLLIGSGGREHALAWKMAQSHLLEQLYCAPGNPGTAAFGENVVLPLNQPAQVVAFAREKRIDLAVIGPEQPLADGLSDALREGGIAVFGPSQAAARIETSKAFSKAFMQRHGIPTADFAVFTDLHQAQAHLEKVSDPVVIKASGLAAGKGVLLPETLEEARAALAHLMQARAFGKAGDQAIIEERLQGEEISLLAFADGHTVRPMPPAQDHKRLLDGDLGPNTGGMGAYAPVSIFGPEQVRAAVEDVLQPAVDGLRLEGTPYVGVLYAGLILTPQGMKVLEFNARFGDPEAQALLPLLESDLLEVLQACVHGKLAGVDVRWKDDAAMCVVMAAAGYPERPEKGRRITLPGTREDAFIFQAGTRQEGEELLTAGGRVLGVTAWAADLAQARGRAYAVLERTRFEGAQFRQDIGQRELARQAAHVSAYRSAGVDIDAGNRAVRLMKDAVNATHDARVLAGVGAFGGLFDAAGLKTMQSPVLVASTDGVGTKVKLAAQLGRLDTIGEDIVNHCINDILVQGARPLFFLDYYASARIQPEAVAAVVGGIARACRAAGCALLGGETAEMPGVYLPEEFDLAGTIVGVLERANLLPRPGIRSGDVLLGLRSSGPHTNGYSLIRRIVAEEDLSIYRTELGSTLGDALLAPHRSYLDALIDLIEQPEGGLKALAHITGGGFIENIPRILPPGLGAVVRKGSWPLPPLFGTLQRQGSVPEAEMYRVFNMGIGMVLVVDPDRVADVRAAIAEECWQIGEVAADASGKVRLA